MYHDRTSSADQEEGLYVESSSTDFTQLLSTLNGANVYVRNYQVCRMFVRGFVGCVVTVFDSVGCLLFESHGVF